MFIEPAQYLDLTDRLTITHKKLQQVSIEREILTQKVITMQEKLTLLQQRVKELQAQKQKTQLNLKQHITTKTNEEIKHISELKQTEKSFIQQQINKLKNQSALNKLKILEERIQQNHLTSIEKQFCQKLKTLYIINKKKANCNINQLYEWISGLIDSSNKNNPSQIDILAGINNSNRNLTESKNGITSSKKSKKKIKKQSQLQPIRQSSQKQNIEASSNGKSRNKKGDEKVERNPLSFLINV